MGEDARISLSLWVGGLCVASGFLAILYFDLAGGIFGKWLEPSRGVMTVIGIGFFAYGLWRRRASNPNNPNRP